MSVFFSSFIYFVEACPRDFTLGGKSCFSKLTGKMDYRQAISQCRRRKANLMTDTSLGDMKSMKFIEKETYWRTYLYVTVIYMLI